MSNIETPVLTQMRDCIWNSFRNSAKRHLLLTGGRGVGKTTIFKALFPNDAKGITTWAKPRKAVFLRENQTDRIACIGEYDESIQGKENKMRPITEGFMTLGIPALARCIASDDEWITIDEIGYLDTTCEAYCDALLRVMANKRVCAVVRRQALPFLTVLLQREDVFLVDLDDLFGNFGCVIMASGLGNRFGGNKLMADFHGEPMISRALMATQGIFSRRIVVTRHEDVVSFCNEKGMETLMHSLPNRNDTVRLGMESMRDVDGCLFCPGDQPLLRWETVASLVLSAKNDTSVIWRTISKDGEQGAPVLFPSSMFSELSKLPEGKGGGFLIKKYPERLRTVTVRDDFELLDADTPEMLRILEEHR